MQKDNFPFFRKKLNNGMTVIFEQRKDSGVVSVAFAVKHGGIHESKEEKGISHFIEHLLYKGTIKRTAKQISEEIEKNGGILNGFTEEEMTAYWCKMPASKLNVALDVLSDMLKNPLFNETELNKEREVIFEEMKMRKDMPNYYVLDKIQSKLFTGNLEFDLIGTKESMSSIDRKKIINKFKEIYTPNNMFLCVVGDTDFNTLCDFCEKTFQKTKESKINEPKIGLKNEEKIETRKGIDQANMIFAFHSPLSSDKMNYASHVLGCIMFGGMSSRLWQEIREKRNLAYAVKGSVNSGKRYAYSSIFVGTKKENLEKIKKIILEEFSKIKDLDENELNQVKEQLIGNNKISREDSQGEMLELIFGEITDKAEKIYEYEKKISEVKLEDVKNLAKIKDFSFLALIPENGETK
jgi:predicted Zn-dependent peptidase